MKYFLPNLLRLAALVVLIAFLFQPTLFEPLLKPLVQANAPAVYSQGSLLSLTLSHLATVFIATLELDRTGTAEVVLEPPCVLDSHCRETIAPFIVHGTGTATETRPMSGYIDPRNDSSDGSQSDLGLTEVFIRFSEPVQDRGHTDGVLSTAAFSVQSTARSDAIPEVLSVDADDMPLVRIVFDRPIPVLHWTTIIANVQDRALVPNPIESLGDLGEQNELDRVDLAYLPGDVEQNNDVGPLDLLLLRKYVYRTATIARGLLEDYADIDRNDSVDEDDLDAFQPVVNRWRDQTIQTPRP